MCRYVRALAWLLTTFLLGYVGTNRPATAEDYSHRQRYWDGQQGAALVAGANCKADLDRLRVDNPGYMRPDLMAIGDSLYNGVQSLRINWWLSEWSAPTLVAVRLGLVDEFRSDRTGTRRFYGPQYPGQGDAPKDTKSFGFNLEGVRASWKPWEWGSLLDIPEEQARNLGELLVYRPPNGRAFVDNIAFSGATTIDLLHWTAADFRRSAEDALMHMAQANRFNKFKYLGNAFTFSNAAFVLNPMRHPCLETLTPVEQVMVRKPRRLLINIGANNGIDMSGFAGVGLDEDSCSQEELELKSQSGHARCVPKIRDFLGAQFTSDMRTILQQLSEVDGLEYVYVNGLALPSQTANVILRPKGRTGAKFYLSILNEKAVRSETIDAADKFADTANRELALLIDQANEKNEQSVGKRPLFVFVDMSAALRAYDYKRCVYQAEGDCASHQFEISAKRFEIPQTQRLDNRPLKARGRSGVLTGKDFAAKISEGGLFSFDNMHLSSIGYEVMAQTVRRAMLAAKDPALVAFGPGDSCKSEKEPGFDKMKQGDCINLLSTPGWSYADATRRDFIFQRIAGDREMSSIDFIQAVLGFIR